MKDFAVVYKKSRYEFIVESDDPVDVDFRNENPEEMAHLLKSRDLHERSFETLLRNLDSIGVTYDTRYRGDLNHVHAKEGVIVFGGDGTVIETTHHLSLPIIGVNPGNSVGFYCGYTADSVFDAFKSDVEKTTLWKIKVLLNGDELLHQAINEVKVDYYKPGPGMSYYLDKGEGFEYFRSTYGLMVATPQGSTGGLRGYGGQTLEIGEDRFAAFPIGLFKGDTFFLNSLRLKSRTKKCVLAIDPYWRHHFDLGDVVEFKKGDLQVIYGNMREKQQRYLE